MAVAADVPEDQCALRRVQVAAVRGTAPYGVVPVGDGGRVDAGPAVGVLHSLLAVALVGGRAVAGREPGDGVVGSSLWRGGDADRCGRRCGGGRQAGAEEGGAAEQGGDGGTGE